MPAYMIIACKIHDRDKFISGYGQAVPKLVDKFGGEYLLVAPGATLLEGTLEGYSSMAISKWPDRDTAMQFWNSDEYARIRPIRDEIADFEVLVLPASR